MPYKATQEDWEDFFKGWDLPQGTTYPVDQNHEWLCVVSQHGRLPLQQTDERLAQQAKKQKSPPSGYVYDR